MQNKVGFNRPHLQRTALRVNMEDGRDVIPPCFMRAVFRPFFVVSFPCGTDKETVISRLSFLGGV